MFEVEVTIGIDTCRLFYIVEQQSYDCSFGSRTKNDLITVIGFENNVKDIIYQLQTDKRNVQFRDSSQAKDN